MGVASLRHGISPAGLLPEIEGTARNDYEQMEVVAAAGATLAASRIIRRRNARAEATQRARA